MNHNLQGEVHRVDQVLETRSDGDLLVIGFEGEVSASHFNNHAHGPTLEDQNRITDFRDLDERLGCFLGSGSHKCNANLQIHANAANGDHYVFNFGRLLMSMPSSFNNSDVSASFLNRYCLFPIVKFSACMR